MKFKIFILSLILIFAFIFSRCSSLPQEKHNAIVAQNFEVSETLYLEDDEKIIWSLVETGYDEATPTDNTKPIFIPEV
jgi:uncharacterized protein involved in cysteine biosynthesis